MMLFLESYKINSQNYDYVNALNNNSMNIYISDYWYIVIKALTYSFILIIFIYFYGIINLIETIKTSAITIKEQTVKVKNKVIEIKDKVVEVKDKIAEEQIK